MGAGIARKFVKRFGGERFRRQVLDANKKRGECAAVGGAIYVHNLITKQRFWQKVRCARTAGEGVCRR